MKVSCIWLNARTGECMYCCNGTFIAMKDPAHDPTVAWDAPNSLRAERQVQMWVSKNKFLPCLCNLWSTGVGVLSRLCEETFLWPLMQWFNDAVCTGSDPSIKWPQKNESVSIKKIGRWMTAVKKNAYKMGYLKVSPDNLKTRQHTD